MPSSTTVDQIDGIALILNDHRNVEALFDQYEDASDDDTKLRLVAKMIEELTTHAAIEELELYPLVEELVPDGARLKAEAVKEHEEARDVLAELERTPVSDGRFDAKVRELVDEVRHHVEEEERQLLPALREQLSEQRLAKLADNLRRAKATAPVSPSQERGRKRALVGNGGARTSKQELYERAQQLDVPGRSQMSKEELAQEVDERE